jgi:hypothetical protein
MNARQALERWRERGLLPDDKVRELEADLAAVEVRRREESSNRGIVIFATVGALLVGLGIVLFVSSNWDGMGPVLRGTVLFGTYAVIAVVAWGIGRRGFERVAEALWFLVTLAFGANIFFLGQIFNFTLTFWQGPLVWLLGVLAMGFARRKRIYGDVAVPLFLLFLGWLGGGAGWFMDDQFEFLFADGGLRPLLPLLGAGLVSLALLLRRRTEWSFLERGARAWGVVLLAAPLLLATADKSTVLDIFRTAGTPKQWVLAIGALVLVVAASAFAVRTVAARGLLAAAGGLSLVLPVSREGHSIVGTLVKDIPLVFFLFVVMIFGLALLTVWIGLRTSQRKLVNTGMASLAVLIFIQYFAWSFELLHRSLAFIVGGLVLLGLAYFMERTRRRLLHRMEAS